MTVPSFKHRLCEVFSFLYFRLCNNLDMLDKKDTFFSLSVQLFTIPEIAKKTIITHDTVQIVMDTLTHVCCGLDYNYKNQLDSHHGIHNDYLGRIQIPFEYDKSKPKPQPLTFKQLNELKNNDKIYYYNDGFWSSFIFDSIKNTQGNIELIVRYPKWDTKKTVQFASDNIPLIYKYNGNFDDNDTKDNNNNNKPDIEMRNIEYSSYDSRPQTGYDAMLYSKNFMKKDELLKAFRFLKHSHTNIQKREWVLVNDLRYILNNDPVVPYILMDNSDILKLFMKLLSIFQNIGEMKRKISTHVEFEDKDWKKAFDISLQLFSICKIFYKYTYMMLGPYNDVDSNTNRDPNAYKNNKLKRIDYLTILQRNKVIKTIEDAIKYGLRFVDIKDYKLVTPFNDDDSKYEIEYEKLINVKIPDLDGYGSYTNCNIFRIDRDNVCMFTPLSRFITSLSIVWCQSTGKSFNELLNTITNNDNTTKNDVTTWLHEGIGILSIVSSIKSDLWKLNGSMCDNILYNYERTEFYNRMRGLDIGLLQYSLYYCNPSDFMNLIIYRHGVYYWFINKDTHKVLYEVKTGINNDDKEKALKFIKNEMNDELKHGWIHWCDHKRTLRMIENLLFIIITVTLSPLFRYVLHDKSQNTLTYDLLKYEIIQWLILNKMTFSEIKKKLNIDDDQDSPQLTHILKSIAIYEKPNKMESGKFSLKKECYNQVDPYFYKYNVEQRAKSNEILQKAIQKTRNNSNNNNNNDTKPNNNEFNFDVNHIKHTDKQRLKVYTTKWFGIILSCILHHKYVNDSHRYTTTMLDHALKIVGIMADMIKQNVYDNTDKKKLINNLTKEFDFRLTNKYDFNEQSKDIKKLFQGFGRNAGPQNNQHDLQSLFNFIGRAQNVGNADEVRRILEILNQRQPATFRNRIPNIFGFNRPGEAQSEVSTSDDDIDYDEGRDNNNNNNDTNTKTKTPPDQYAELSKLKYESILNKNQAGTNVISYLCLLICDKNVTDIKKDSVLLIKKILITLFEANINEINEIILKLWDPTPYLSKNNTPNKANKLDKKYLKRKKRAEKARKKAMNKMNKMKSQFMNKNENVLKKNRQKQIQEEQDELEGNGIGVSFECVVCRSRHNQHEMSLIGFARVSSILKRCNKERKAFENKSIDNNELNRVHPTFITFCGHSIHFSCYEKYMMQIHDKDANQAYYFAKETLRLKNNEFVCPYCKTISNILLPNISQHIQTIKMSKHTVDQFKLNKNYFVNKGMTNPELFAQKYLMNIDNINDINIDTQLVGEFLLRFDRVQYFKNENYALRTNSFLTKNICEIRKDETMLLYLPCNIANSIHYTIKSRCKEYELYTKKQRMDKFTRNKAMFNNLVTSMWSLIRLSNEHILIDKQKNDLSNYSNDNNNNGNNNDSTSNDNTKKADMLMNKLKQRFSNYSTIFKNNKLKQNLFTKNGMDILYNTSLGRMSKLLNTDDYDGDNDVDMKDNVINEYKLLASIKRFTKKAVKRVCFF